MIPGRDLYLERSELARPANAAIVPVLEAFRGRLVTSNYVVDETVTICRCRLGFTAAAWLGERLTSGGGVDVVRVTPEDERAAWALFLQRADKADIFTDCTSFVLMRRLAIRQAAATDDDFRREGFAVSPAR